MEEYKDLEMKVAENPREALIHKTLDEVKKGLENLELQVELNKVLCDYLEKQIKETKK